MDKPSYKNIYKILEESALLKKPPDFKGSKIYKDWKSAAGTSIFDNTTELAIEDNILHVSVSSSTWAHELINQQNSILQILRESGHNKLTEMSIRIQVPKSPKTPALRKKKKQTRTITPSMQKLFVRLASQSKNSEAKNIFLRLSKSQKKLNE